MTKRKTRLSKREVLNSLDDFTQSYLESALWAESDSDDEPLDNNYDISDFTLASLLEARRDCEGFQDENEKALEEAYELSEGYDEELAGFDFWLTRNGHGAGFWDRGLGNVGRELTQASEAYGYVNIQVYGGKLHLS